MWLLKHSSACQNPAGAGGSFWAGVFCAQLGAWPFPLTPCFSLHLLCSSGGQFLSVALQKNNPDLFSVPVRWSGSKAQWVLWAGGSRRRGAGELSSPPCWALRSDCHVPSKCSLKAICEKSVLYGLCTKNKLLLTLYSSIPYSLASARSFKGHTAEKQAQSPCAHSLDLDSSGVTLRCKCQL